MVAGTTMRLMTSEAIAMETALALPNSSPRMAGPMNGAAGADAIIAVNTLSLSEKRRTKRNSRNTRPYRPTMATNIATANATSLTNSARVVPIVPTKSAIGTAYNITIRLRIVASAGSKSWRQAATKPSSRVTTIGASAPRTVSTISIPVWWIVQNDRLPSDWSMPTKVGASAAANTKPPVSFRLRSIWRRRHIVISKAWWRPGSHEGVHAQRRLPKRRRRIVQDWSHRTFRRGRGQPKLEVEQTVFRSGSNSDGLRSR